MPGSRIYRRLKTFAPVSVTMVSPRRTDITWKQTTLIWAMIMSLIHVIEHGIVATLDIIFEHTKTGKWSDVLNT
ncbi:MAG: hypothetical protein CL941_04290 [Desulfobacter sp.]|nr:hypothetical protein [Desulfobacter sp.]